VYARVAPGGQAGGIEQFVASLVRALGELEPGDEEYLVLGSHDNGAWLSELLGPNQRLVALESIDVSPAAQLAARVARRAPAAPVLRKLGVDVVHHPYQVFLRTGIPALFHPHDFAHLHFPQFFSETERRRRRRLLERPTREAAIVVTESHATRDDVVRRLRVPRERVHVVRRGAPTEFYADVDAADLAACAAKHALPARFLLYPAQAWPHKNHRRLLDALELVRRREGLELELVCTGAPNEFSPALAEHARALGLESRVRFLGFVSTVELRCLYRLALGMVFPSLWEGGGMPIVEAFHEATPVACATTPAVAEYAGDAALLFEPTSVESIADALWTLATDEALRRELAKRGAARAGTFTWPDAAHRYRILYRLAARRPVAPEELALLEAA
jgi:glycosyltransferase involved in cell wall biosynthesis